MISIAAIRRGHLLAPATSNKESLIYPRRRPILSSIVRWKRFALIVAGFAVAGGAVALLVLSLGSGSSNDVAESPILHRSVSSSVLDRVRKGDSEGTITGLLGTRYTVTRLGDMVAWRFESGSSRYPVDVFFRNQRVVGMAIDRAMLDQPRTKTSPAELLPCVWRAGMVPGCGSILRG